MNISRIIGICCRKCILNFSFISPRVTSKLVNDNTEAFYRMSRLYFELGEEEDALRLAVTTSELLAAVATFNYLLLTSIPTERSGNV